MPEGSSSAAPVIKPGPRSAKNPRRRAGRKVATERRPRAPFFSRTLGDGRLAPPLPGAAALSQGMALSFPGWAPGSPFVGTAGALACARKGRGRPLGASALSYGAASRRSRRTGLGPLLASSIQSLSVLRVRVSISGYAPGTPDVNAGSVETCSAAAARAPRQSRDAPHGADE